MLPRTNHPWSRAGYPVVSLKAAIMPAIGASLCALGIALLTVLLSPTLGDVAAMGSIGALGAGLIFFAAVGLNSFGKRVERTRSGNEEERNWA